VPSNGLLYPPASVEDIPFVTRPDRRRRRAREEGHGRGDLLARGERPHDPYDIRMGVWVTVEAETDYIRNCFEEYNAHTDPSGRYFTLYKRWHLIGLEVGVSVASVALRGEATGVATCWNADVVATAKRDLQPGDCSTAKAATPSGASSSAPRPRSAWAACRSAWPTTSRSCGR
jgi:predicted homoserine dehydrogenase-like protein